MIWNFLRRSVWGPALISVSVIIGIFLDRIRVYVAAYSVSDQSAEFHGIKTIPPTVYPDVADVFIVIGAIAGPILVYMLISRVIPIINIWEQKELLLYKLHKKYHRATVMVLGKPE